MIQVYATTENGEGYVTSLGEYETADEIELYIGTFSPNTKITFYETFDPDEDEDECCIEEETLQEATSNSKAPGEREKDSVD